MAQGPDYSILVVIWVDIHKIDQAQDEPKVSSNLQLFIQNLSLIPFGENGPWLCGSLGPIS